jgi:hypothetical protein
VQWCALLEGSSTHQQPRDVTAAFVSHWHPSHLVALGAIGCDAKDTDISKLMN